MAEHVLAPPPGPPSELVTTIYVLKDPDTLAVRYVGKTTWPLRARLSGHCLSTSLTPCDRWAMDLVARGKRPIIQPLEVVLGAGWTERERYWIAEMRRRGASLLNVRRWGCRPGRGRQGMDLTRQQFGAWTVLGPDRARRKKGQRYWLCRCECGTEKSVLQGILRSPGVHSCGCRLRPPDTIRMRYKDGKREETPEYRAWFRMRNCCHLTSHPDYSEYGGRGIEVCAEWRASFERFFADMGRRPSDAHSVDRIDNNGPYAPWNCRWATKKEQADNRRSNISITFEGRTMNLMDWAREFGISFATLKKRLGAGLSVERALTDPTQPGRKRRL